MQKSKSKSKSNPNRGNGKLMSTRSLPAANAITRQGSLPAEMVISHREFMFNLSGNSSTFLLLGSSGAFPGYDLNPGNRIMFPWLGVLSAAFEKYRFEALKFEIVPRNPTSVPGAMYAALDYDWDDTPATSVAELMSNRGAISSDVWSPSTLTVDVRRLNEDVPYRYVADFPRTDTSQRMVYGGFLMIAISGTTSSVSFDVFCEYKIRLSLPALHSIDSVSSYTLPDPVTLAAGVAQYWKYLPTLAGFAQAVVGQGGVPVFTSAGVVPPVGYPVYRLGAVNRGSISLTANPATAGSPPSSYVTDTSFNGVLFDAKGAWVADLGSSSASFLQVNPGPDSAATWATNGALGKAGFSISLAAIRALYPLAVYLVPYIASVAGRVLSTSTKLSARYTEL